MAARSAWWWTGRGVVALVALFALAQLIRPARTNPAEDPKHRVDAVLPVDSTTASLLDAACADCHSDRTRWPWYSGVAPVSWLLAHDVNDGREELNFSEWGAYPPEKQAKKLAKICEEVREGDMPPATYRWIHASARITSADAEAICRWTASAPKAAPPPSTPVDQGR